MNDVDVIVLLMRWAHILSAIVAVGGSFFMRMVLMPAANAALSDDEHAKLRPVLVKRWQKVIHVCILLFLISGFYNYLVVTSPMHQGQPLYHMLFGIKFLLAMLVFFLAIVLTSLKPWAARVRANAKLWLGLLVALAITVVLISGFLRNLPVSTENSDTAVSAAAE